MPPSTLLALPYVYCDRTDIQSLCSPDGEAGRLDDDNNGTLSGAELAVETWAINAATAKVNDFCAQRYGVDMLATSYTVNLWTTIIACHLLSYRRGNPPPGSFAAAHKEVIEELKQVKDNKLDLDLAERESQLFTYSNVSVDSNYWLRKTRVERPISDQSPRTYPVNRDIGADVIFEPS